MNENVDERSCRYLKSKNARNVKKYVSYVREKVGKLKLQRAAEKIRYRVLTGRVTDQGRIRRELNNIDRAFQEILMTAEKLLKPIQQETSCERLWELKRKRTYWRAVIFLKKNQTKKALKHMWSGGYSDDLLMPREEQLLRLDAAQTEVMLH